MRFVFCLLGAVCVSLPQAHAAESRPPNFIVVFCDNLGYGDIEPFGSTLHRTPNLNRMAAEGRSVTHLLARNFGELSHGEQKRVLIARALVNDPELLVLDEPAGGLDFPGREDLLAEVERLAQSGRTVIYVTHHVEEIMPSFNRCLLMKNGSVYASGNRDEVLTERLLNEVLGYRFSLVEKDGRLWPRHF